jgi:hypothetical protein
MEKWGGGDFESGRLLHAYIVSCESEERRWARAREMAAAMVCVNAGPKPCRTCRHCRKVLAGSHPDVTTVARRADDKGKPRREIVVDQIRALVKDAYILPNEAERKVYLLRDAEYMNTEAQNAFLKLLEEPPPFTSFVLCAGNAALLLPTVRSRCIEIHLGAEDTLPPEKAGERADAYIRAVASGDPAALLRCCVAMEKLDAAAAAEFVEAGRERLCDMLCRRADSLGLTRDRLLEMDKLLSRASAYLLQNVGVRHVMGLLAVRVPV